MQKNLLTFCLCSLLSLSMFLTMDLEVVAGKYNMVETTKETTNKETKKDTSFLYDLGVNDIKKSETKGTRVFGDELLMFDQNDDKTKTNTNILSTTIYSKEDLDLCGLKGTIEIEDNKYLLTYTGVDDLIINQTSLIETFENTMYAFSNVPIYSELKETSETIGTYAFNENVSVVGRYEDWYKVEYNGQSGYIKNAHISNEKVQLKRENGKTRLYSGDTMVGEDLEKVNLGTFKLTAYCNCEVCCGQWSAYGKTASGTTTTLDRTVAVDKSLIPLGTNLTINGQNYVAEDTGSAVNDKVIDVYLGDHQTALQFGVRYRDVEVHIN